MLIKFLLKYNITSKYLNWYDNIIEKAQNENRVKGDICYENHHILPVSLFPKYKNLRKYKWNSVLLTPREHYICHMCLYKHYKHIKYTFGIIKSGMAIRMIMNGKNNFCSRTYQHIKDNITYSHTEETKEKLRQVNLGKKHSEETKKKMSNTKKINGYQPFWNNGLTKYTSIKVKEMGEKVSKALIGKPKSENHRKNISKAKKGSNSSSAKKINIYDNNNILKYSCYGNFEKICRKNNLPFLSLKKTLYNNTVLYENISIRTKTLLENNGNIKYKGWYARYEEVLQIVL